MASRKQIVSDQAAAAWLSRHPWSLAALGATLAADVAQSIGQRTAWPLGGFLFLWLIVWCALRLVLVGVWWNKRRRLLARHSLPAPSFVTTVRTMREERRRIKYVHKQWAAFCSEHGLTGVGKIVPRLHKITSTVSGDLTAVITPGKIGVKTTAGMTAVERIRSFAPGLAEVTGCAEVDVRPIRDQHTAIVTFMWTQPLERILPAAELPRAPEGHIAYGIRRDDKPATIVAGLSVLTSGLTGSGKSSLEWAMLADLNRQGINVDLYASDPKGGIELGVLKELKGDRTSSLYVADYCDNALDTKRLIEACERTMKERQARQQGRKWTVKDAESEPLVILLLDECIEVMATMKTAGPTNNKSLPLTQLKTIISQGRASGVMVIASTQMAQKEVLGDVRDMFAQRLCLATRSAINTDMVLGDGAEAAGAFCSRIVNRPGIGYSFNETQRNYSLFRAAWCDDDDIKRIALGQTPDGMDTGHGKGEVNRSTAVYRFYNANRELLYVGITVDLAARWGQHAASKPWWSEVDMSKTLVTWHPSEAEARQIEEREIKTQYPRYNKQHNGSNPIAVTHRAVVQPAPVAYLQPRAQAPTAYRMRRPVQPTLEDAS